MGSGSSVELEKARAHDAPHDASDFSTLFDARQEIVRMRELLLDPLSDPALKAAAAAPRSRVEASTSPLQLSALTQADPSYLSAKPRAVAEISIPNLKANLQLMQEHCVRSGLKIMLMLSADAFGCGLAMTAKLAMQAGVEVFGVSTLEDALKLRHAGIYVHDARVVVMGPVDTSEFPAFIKHDVEFLVQSIGTIQRVLTWCTSKAAQEYGDRGAALLCHILLNNPSNKTSGLNFAPEYRWHSTQTIKQLLTVTDPATQEKMAKEKDLATMLVDGGGGSGGGNQPSGRPSADAWFCPVCNSENRVSRGFDKKCRVCKATPTVQIRHDHASETYRPGVRVHLRGLCSHLHAQMVSHGAVLEQYKTVTEALRMLSDADFDVPNVHLDSSEAVLHGYLDKTNIVRLLSRGDDAEALVKIQQMQGVVARKLADTDGRTFVNNNTNTNSGGSSGTSALVATSAALSATKISGCGDDEADAEDRKPTREILARVASAVYGCVLSRAARREVKPVLTVRAQIREMYLCRQGDYVGSDRSFQAAYDCIIGVAAIGYGDGYPPGLANEGKVTIRDHSFRVVGAVQMDHVNINLGVPESSAPGASVKIGDYATMFGAEGACSWHSMAAACAGNPPVSAIMSAVSSRVSRYYVSAEEVAARDAAALRAVARKQDEGSHEADGATGASGNKCRCVERLSLGYCRVHDKERSALIAGINLE